MNCSERSPGRRALGRNLAILVVLSAGGATTGDEPVRLTTDGTLKLAPVFIDKGDEIVFATHEAPNLVAVVCLKLSDGHIRWGISFEKDFGVKFLGSRANAGTATRRSPAASSTDI